jgi:hypothetical protein
MMTRWWALGARHETSPSSETLTVRRVCNFIQNMQHLIMEVQVFILILLKETTILIDWLRPNLYLNLYIGSSRLVLLKGYENTTRDYPAWDSEKSRIPMGIWYPLLVYKLSKMRKWSLLSFLQTVAYNSSDFIQCNIDNNTVLFI